MSMLRVGDAIELSASDLVGHLNCRSLTSLDLAVANGVLARPKVWDPLADILRERGARHEAGYVAHLRASGLEITVIEGRGVDDSAVSETLRAMRTGAEIIVQAAFRADGWSGRADVLRRVAVPSDLGDWSYEVVDAKLARETKAGTVLQLCLYSELLGRLQGLTPEFMYVVAPWSGYQPQTYRTADYGAYFRRAQASLQRALTVPAEDYPDPKEHCEVCRWRTRCEAERRADDHLCLIAGISKVQITELQGRDVQTMAGLAAVPLPLPWKPDRGSAQSFERVREQARIQCEGRAAGRTIYELLPLEPGFGFHRLPAPSLGDIFLDLEGDPFAGDGGLEYLFGFAYSADDGTPTYTADWAFSRGDEKVIFQRFVNFVMQRLERHPDLHIFHYAPYEPAALKRLMGRHATCEDQVDRMLRSQLFVDLFSVSRHAFRASVESYSIKRLEPLYGFERDVALAAANPALAKVQVFLELGDVRDIDTEAQRVVQGYNRDDCFSTWRLRDWLEDLRTQQIARGATIDRPVPLSGNPSEDLSAWQARVEVLMERLACDVPDDPADRDDQQQARWLLAHTLDWHHREKKALWWDYFRLAALDADELLDERAALSGLSFERTNGGTIKAPIHRYQFPPQETKLRGGEALRNLGGDEHGTVEAISLEDRWVDIKKRKDSAEIHPEAVFAHDTVRTKELSEALMRLGEYVADHGIAGVGRYQAARDLLLRCPPRLGGASLQVLGETASEAAIRIAPLLKSGLLPIQGPPGSGKTYTAAHMICRLVHAGAKVGITSNSHKVIRNLLDETVKAARTHGLDLRCMQKVPEKEDDQHSLCFTTDNATLLAAIGTSCHVAGATAWFWARPDAANAVDVLLVDEAAQMSLANVLASSQAATTLVLVGDPQQLDQPIQGSHPEGTDVSALTQILGADQTIAEGRGLFLEQSWRLHPDICAFTSELFYEGRLHPRPGLEVQVVRSAGRMDGTGLRYVAVHHDGNQSSSPEEADEVERLVDNIRSTGALWVDRDGVERTVTLDDILIIAPYNAQVFELQDRLPGARIGTVDKFQGQEAAIVIYSMTTSSHADAPRGMEFLYSPNRLNVATSRAKCICILVASPTVFEAECRTPRQMQLANAFCRYLELATAL
jgi:uncharacterized protein